MRLRSGQRYIPSGRPARSVRDLEAEWKATMERAREAREAREKRQEEQKTTAPVD